jgi:hypothetical protein
MRPELPHILADIVALAMTKRPETRYQNGEQFAADLRSVMSQLSGVEVAAPVKPLAAGIAATRKRAVFIATAPSMHFAETAPATLSEFEKTVFQPVVKPNQASAGGRADTEI